MYIFTKSPACIPLDVCKVEDNQSNISIYVTSRKYVVEIELFEYFCVNTYVIISNCWNLLEPGVNKKPKKFKTVWHGFWGILKLSGRVNQASLKLSAGFSNTVC